MHVELEFMPGKRSYFPQVMLGVRLEWDRENRTFHGGSGFGFGSYVYRKHNIIPSKADSSLHLEDKNTWQGRDIGDTSHKN